jgi:hypothetical protein
MSARHTERAASLNARHPGWTGSAAGQRGTRPSLTCPSATLAAQEVERRGLIQEWCSYAGVDRGEAGGKDEFPLADHRNGGRKANRPIGGAVRDS